MKLFTTGAILLVAVATYAQPTPLSSPSELVSNALPPLIQAPTLRSSVPQLSWDTLQHSAVSLIDSARLNRVNQQLAKNHRQSVTTLIDTTFGKLDPQQLTTTPLPADLQTTPPLRLLEGEVLADSSVQAWRSRWKNHPVREPVRIKERASVDSLKQVVLSKRPSFIDRSYLETTVGLSPPGSELLQLVPTVGTYLTRHLALGTGIDATLNGFKQGQLTAGLKTLARVDVLPRRLYLQLENTSYFSKVSYLKETAETARQNIQVPYVGGGILLDVFRTKSINLSLMHRLGDQPLFQEGQSAWIIRAGLSFFAQPKLPIPHDQ